MPHRDYNELQLPYQSNLHWQGHSHPATSCRTALCTPGQAVPARPEFFPAAACRFSTASPAAPDCNPPRDASLTRHQQGFTVIHPTPAFPSPVTPGGTGSLGFPLSFAPGRAGPGNARQGGDRPGHCLDYVSGISQPPSTYSLTTCDLTSHEYPDLPDASHQFLAWRYLKVQIGGSACVLPDLLYHPALPYALST